MKSLQKYKLTNQNLQTYGGFQWTLGNKETASGEDDLCGPGWLHYYHHPLLAVLLNPIHANIKEPRLFEVLAEGEHKDDRGLKGGCTEMTLLKEIPLPEVTEEHRIAFGILCAKEVEEGKEWNEWADNWLSGKDRSEESAIAIKSQYTYYASNAANAAYYAANAANHIYYADYYAANAANYAAYKGIDLIKCAEKAMKKNMKKHRIDRPLKQKTGILMLEDLDFQRLPNKKKRKNKKTPKK